MGIEITNELEFDSVDRFALRTFLTTRAGLRMVPKILEQVPVLLDKGEINEILIRSGQVQGFSRAVQTLLSLAEATPEPAAPERISYPPLEADDQWQDGQTLNKK